MRILTNMTFWQSAVWMAETDSIYPDHGRTSSVRYAPLEQARLLFEKRQHYDVIHTMGMRTSMAYAFLCRHASEPARQIMTEVFIDPPQPWNPLWQAKRIFFRALARSTVGVITNSQAEIPFLATRLGLPEQCCRFVPLNSMLDPVGTPEPGEGFVLAAGRSHRDYGLLLRAVEELDTPVRIVADSTALRGRKLPGHVRVLHEVPRKDYLDLLRRCTLCALPLRETVRPVGQLVMLEAMALGKPVVATRNPGTVNYIKDRCNGLLVPPGNPEAFRWALRSLINDPTQIKRLGGEALETVRSRHTHDLHARARLQAIHELMAARVHQPSA